MVEWTSCVPTVLCLLCNQVWIALFHFLSSHSAECLSNFTTTICFSIPILALFFYSKCFYASFRRLMNLRTLPDVVPSIRQGMNCVITLIDWSPCGMTFHFSCHDFDRTWYYVVNIRCVLISNFLHLSNTILTTIHRLFPCLSFHFNRGDLFETRSILNLRCSSICPLYYTFLVLTFLISISSVLVYCIDCREELERKVDGLITANAGTFASVPTSNSHNISIW